MKLTFKKDDLLNGINIVLKAVPSKTTMSILECILIDASTGDIKLTANDMELGIETRVEGSVLEKGKIALDARLFSEIVRKLSSGDAEVVIESDEKYNTVISCENSVFKIQGKDGDEFSYLPYIEKNQYICLSQFTLKAVSYTHLYLINVVRLLLKRLHHVVKERSDRRNISRNIVDNPVKSKDDRELDEHLQASARRACTVFLIDGRNLSVLLHHGILISFSLVLFLDGLNLRGYHGHQLGRLLLADGHGEKYQLNDNGK